MIAFIFNSNIVKSSYYYGLVLTHPQSELILVLTIYYVPLSLLKERGKRG